jgi:hypothetical protein
MNMQEIVTSLRMTLNGRWPPTTTELESYGQQNALLCSVRASIIAIVSSAKLFDLGMIGEYCAPIHFRRADRPTYAVGTLSESIYDSVAANSFGSGA